MGKQRYAAFFDFDGTLIRGDSQVMELRYSIRYGYQSVTNIFRILASIITGILSYLGLLSALDQNLVYIKAYHGISREKAILMGESLFSSLIRKHFILQSLNLLEKQRNDGALIVIISATTSHILEPVRRYLNPDFIICTYLETDSTDKFTGNPLGNICIGEEKVKQVHDLAVKCGIDLTQSYAYSDHHSDLPLLEAVGNPIIVNPTAKLADIAGRRNWPVYRFKETCCV